LPAVPWPHSARLPSNRIWPAFGRSLPGNVPARGGHLTCFAWDGCETGPQLTWAHSGGIRNRPVWRGLFLKSGGLQIEPVPKHSIVAGFLSTRIVLAGSSSTRRLAWIARGGACSDVFAQVADRGAGGVGTGGRLLPVQYQLDDPDVLLGPDVSESILGCCGRGTLDGFAYNSKRRWICLGRNHPLEFRSQPGPAHNYVCEQYPVDSDRSRFGLHFRGEGAGGRSDSRLGGFGSFRYDGDHNDRSVEPRGFHD